MSCCVGGLAATDISVQSDLKVQAVLEEQRLVVASKDLGDGILQSDFHVPEMHCAACIGKIERGLQALPFVTNARVNLSTRRVSVLWKKSEGTATKIVEVIAGLGYDATIFDIGDMVKNSDAIGRRLLAAVGVAGFAGANIMLLSVSVWSGADGATRQLFQLISGMIAIPAIVYAGQPFFTSAFKALRTGRLNMDVPISVGVLLAFAMSFYEAFAGGPEVYFDASVTLLFFLLIGRYLDHRMREKARDVVTRLSRMAAKGASVIQPDGALHFVAIGDIQPGMQLSIAAGERIPVDGRIIQGSSELDRSLVTGESLPVPARPGLDIEAGTLNLSSHIVLEVTKVAGQSFLAEVIQMMEAAEQGKTRYVRIADRAARIYAPMVHLLALSTFIGWMVWTGGDWHMSIYIAISVLIITCPCALGLAVPIVHVVGANRLFSNGIMIKDGAAFEKLCDIDTVVFDKTGTLTLGKPSVFSSNSHDPLILGHAAALAACSAHPYAKAIARFAKTEGLSFDTPKEVKETAGFGVEGVVSGKLARLGRRDWVMEIAAPDVTPGTSLDMASEVLFAFKGEPPCVFGLTDELRSDARQTVAALKAAGLNVEILSGDREPPVTEIARQLSVTTFHYGQTPADKTRRIAELQAQGRKVFVVGDGLNDAPALAAGNVSMAPSSGSDVGRLAADIVFTGESLKAVDFARSIARQTGRLVMQNFTLAIAYNFIAVPLAVVGLVTPLVAAIAMSGSSIIVVANSMRLSVRNPRETDLAPTSPQEKPFSRLESAA